MTAMIGSQLRDDLVLQAGGSAGPGLYRTTAVGRCLMDWRRHSDGSHSQLVHFTAPRRLHYGTALRPSQRPSVLVRPSLQGHSSL